MTHQDFMTEAYRARLETVRQTSGALTDLDHQRAETQRLLNELISDAVADGVPVAIIARHTGIPRQTIHRWMRGVA